MKQFNLDEYLENPTKKVVTRDGRNVTIHCMNCAGSHPVIAEIEGEKYSYFYDKNGGYHFRPSINDLFFAPEKREGWINIFKHFPNNDYLYNCSRTKSQVFKSKESAEKEGKDCLGYITTIKIEWDE